MLAPHIEAEVSNIKRLVDADPDAAQTFIDDMLDDQDAAGADPLREAFASLLQELLS